MTGPEICDPKYCTGCSACANICPKTCISMELAKDGSIYPVVDQGKCIDCRMCVKVCPGNKIVNLKIPVTAYAGWHEDRKEYLSSTSGGAAAAFTQVILGRGGVVYGCVSRTGLVIEHIRIDTLEGAKELKGSKYVQSNIGLIYRDVRKDLKEGREVLFVGTPCQVAGLKGFLGKEYDSLYCTALICHGVPSQQNLRKHVLKVTHGRGTRVQFRKGNDMGLRIYDSEGEQIYYSNVWYERHKDTYYSTFIDGYSYRDSCYTCKYACPKRVSDVTIGDFWGLGKDVEHDGVNGCSVILPVTPKGMTLVKDADLHLIERTVEEAVNGNSQLRHPSRLTKRVRIFRQLWPVIGRKAAYRLCEGDRIIDRRLLKRIKRRLRR